MRTGITFVFAIHAALLTACGDPEPQALEDCASLSDAGAREECRYTFVAPLVGDKKALDAALEQIPEAESRDLLLLRLAIAEPRKAARLCEKVTTPGADERCRQVLGRPHLQSTPKAPKDPPSGRPPAPGKGEAPPPPPEGAPE